MNNDLMILENAMLEGWKWNQQKGWPSSPYVFGDQLSLRNAWWHGYTEAEKFFNKHKYARGSVS